MIWILGVAMGMQIILVMLTIRAAKNSVMRSQSESQNIQDDAHSILVVVSDDSLVCVGSI